MRIFERRNIKWIALLGAMLIVGALLIVGLAFSSLPISTMMRSPVMRLATVLLLLLPVMLIALLVLVVLDSKRTDTTVISVESVPSLNQAQAESAPVEGEESEENGERAPRFCMLSRIDENRGVFEQKEFDDDVSLQSFCENFRNYAAGELNLYYDILPIR